MRADRLLTLLLLLHSKGHMTARNLADELEVSERTIYRDVEALSAAGVPVYTQSGVNGGIFLDEHYRLSLVGLSKAEIHSLVVSAGAGPLADLGLAGTIEDTLLKLAAALPSIHRDEVARMRQRIYIDPVGWFQLAEPVPCLPLLQQAIWEDREIHFGYQRRDGSSSARTVEAYALVAKSGAWYLVGRQENGEMRTFRVSRLQDICLTERHFDRQADFDLEAYWQAASREFEGQILTDSQPLTAVVRIHPDWFWYLAGSLAGQYERIERPDPDGWIVLRLKMASLLGARMALLPLGGGVEVLEPGALRESLIEAANAVLDRHR